MYDCNFCAYRKWHTLSDWAPKKRRHNVIKWRRRLHVQSWIIIITIFPPQSELIHKFITADDSWLACKVAREYWWKWLHTATKLRKFIIMIVDCLTNAQLIDYDWLWQSSLADHVQSVIQSALFCSNPNTAIQTKWNWCQLSLQQIWLFSSQCICELSCHWFKSCYQYYLNQFD